ncbi:hypothetical protein HDU96_009457 [Phlyctochytrium bullatum]|nr:hypothetical protein HDU96_009457 [Phlyctochytrium bullatum]
MKSVHLLGSSEKADSAFRANLVIVESLLASALVRLGLFCSAAPIQFGHNIVFRWIYNSVFFVINIYALEMGRFDKTLALSGSATYEEIDMVRKAMVLTGVLAGIKKTSPVEEEWKQLYEGGKQDSAEPRAFGEAAGPNTAHNRYPPGPTNLTSPTSFSLSIPQGSTDLGVTVPATFQARGQLRGIKFFSLAPGGGSASGISGQNLALRTDSRDSWPSTAVSFRTAPVATDASKTSANVSDQPASRRMHSVGVSDKPPSSWRMHSVVNAGGEAATTGQGLSTLMQKKKKMMETTVPGQDCFDNIQQVGSVELPNPPASPNVPPVEETPGPKEQKNDPLAGFMQRTTNMTSRYSAGRNEYGLAGYMATLSAAIATFFIREATEASPQHQGRPPMMSREMALVDIALLTLASVAIQMVVELAFGIEIALQMRKLATWQTSYMHIVRPIPSFLSAGRTYIARGAPI